MPERRHETEVKDTNMKSFWNALGKFFGVFLRGQTYLNMLYLLLSFPLGLFYFTFLVVGISVGVPLVILWVGLLILLVVFALWYAFVVFERQMAITLLREDIPPISRQDLTGKTLWQKFTATLGNPVTWKGLVYLLAKFPLGIISFVFLVALVSLSAASVGAPFYYYFWPPSVDLTLTGTPWTNIWIIDTMPEALLLSLVGIFVTLGSMHILNGLAWLSGKFARVMLGNFSPAPVAPVAPAAPTPVAAPLSSAAVSAPETPVVVEQPVAPSPAVEPVMPAEPPQEPASEKPTSSAA